VLPRRRSAAHPAAALQSCCTHAAHVRRATSRAQSAHARSARERRVRGGQRRLVGVSRCAGLAVHIGGLLVESHLSDERPRPLCRVNRRVAPRSGAVAGTRGHGVDGQADGSGVEDVAAARRVEGAQRGAVRNRVDRPREGVGERRAVPGPTLRAL
jgi:hypothetical protein